MNLQLDSKAQSNQLAETINVMEILQVLLTRKWLLIVMACIGLLIGSVVAIRSPLIYQPFALIQIDQKNNMLSSMNLPSAVMSNQMDQSASQSDIEMTLMQSPYILEPVIRALGLNIEVTPKRLPIIGGLLAAMGFGQDAHKLIHVSLFNTPTDEHMQAYTLVVKSSSSYQLFSPTDQLVLTGHVGQVESSSDGTVSILVTDLNAPAGMVFDVSNTSMTKLLRNLSTSLQMTELSPPDQGGGSIGQTGIIQLSMNTANPDLAKKIIDYVIGFTVNASSKAASAQNQKLLTFIKNQIPITQTNLNTAEINLNAYQAKTGIASLSIQSQTVLKQITSIDSKISANQMNKAQLLQIYTQKNPIIQNINLENQTLEAQRGQLQSTLATLPLKDQKIVDLMRNVKAQQAIYALLLTKYQQTVLANAATTSDIHVLTYTQIPDEPLPSHIPLTILASGLAGVIVGALISLALHFVQGGITDPYWAEKELGIRTLAIIPFSKAQARAKKAFDKKETTSIPILAQTEPDDICVESIRSLRTNLLLNMKEHHSNIVSVGGVIPATGKSFVSVNLAVILAESGKRVLLIDADMRRGYLNQYFELSHSPGLSEALENVYPLEKIVRRTKIGNLDFISTGLFPRNPSELLLGERFGEMLQILSSQYDVVIIDAPPILVVTDASLIAQKAGINYMVIPGSQLKAHEIESAVRRFYNDGVKINGVLFNFAKKMHEQTSKYGHSYGRYAQYYQRKQ